MSFNINNATGIMIHLPTNSLVLLRDKKTKKWMTPGGKIDPIDSQRGSREFNCFKREFYEETGHVLPRVNIINSFIYGRTGHTKIYICTFTEDINFTINNETDKMALVNLDDLINTNFSLIDFPIKEYVRNSLLYANLETAELKLSFNINHDKYIDITLSKSSFKPALIKILNNEILPNLRGSIWIIQENYQRSKTLEFILHQLNLHGIPIYPELNIPIEKVLYKTADLILQTINGIENIGFVYSY